MYTLLPHDVLAIFPLHACTSHSCGARSPFHSVQMDLNACLARLPCNADISGFTDGQGHANAQLSFSRCITAHGQQRHDCRAALNATYS